MRPAPENPQPSTPDHMLASSPPRPSQSANALASTTTTISAPFNVCTTCTDSTTCNAAAR
ncbi:hypothetical protein BC830DRAFT_1102366 [Chytriomyces sp. MP71]|nr:hypothetical protein BC830DRAFT_1102366 [Chytriomyces sp. MP71]